MKEIPLPHGRFALVDDGDYEAVRKYSWHAQRGRVCRSITLPSGKKSTISLHRQLMNPPPGMVVDHINGNVLDNRRDNLRVCTSQENPWNQRKHSNNTSGMKGVIWNRQKGNWEAQLGINGRRIHLGYFKTPVEAAQAYNVAAKEAHGEFAHLNPVPSGSPEPHRRVLMATNKSGFRGVYWAKRDKRWKAQIGVAKRSIFIGNFKTKEEAAIAYNEAAVRYFGDAAVLNQLPGRAA